MLLNFAHATGGRGYRLQNDGAKNFTVSRNGKTYTFHIRRGMKLSNGAPLNAKNYEHALLRVLNPAVGSPLASFLTDPASVKIVGRSTTTPENADGLRHLTGGPTRSVIKLVKANPLLPRFWRFRPRG